MFHMVFLIEYQCNWGGRGGNEVRKQPQLKSVGENLFISLLTSVPLLGLLLALLLLSSDLFSILLQMGYCYPRVANALSVSTPSRLVCRCADCDTKNLFSALLHYELRK
jgi:hypothetical protein